MARYKKHVIAVDDTLQTIAEQELGDVTQWHTLAQANNLQYPYIVNSSQDKLTNVGHLVSIGDTIVIPIISDLAGVDAESLTKRDHKNIMTTILGTDLKVNGSPAYFNPHGVDNNILQLSGTTRYREDKVAGGYRKSRDLALVSGLENIKQTLLLHILTPKGSLVMHPDYGSNIQDIIGSPTGDQTAINITNELSRCLLSDSRIENVSLITYNLDGENYHSSWNVTLQDFNEDFILYINKDENNDFSIQ